MTWQACPYPRPGPPPGPKPGDDVDDDPWVWGEGTEASGDFPHVGSEMRHQVTPAVLVLVRRGRYDWTVEVYRAGRVEDSRWRSERAARREAWRLAVQGRVADATPRPGLVDVVTYRTASRP
jgi:hypothetical protein